MCGWRPYRSKSVARPGVHRLAKALSAATCGASTLIGTLLHDRLSVEEGRKTEGRFFCLAHNARREDRGTVLLCLQQEYQKLLYLRRHKRTVPLSSPCPCHPVPCLPRSGCGPVGGYRSLTFQQPNNRALMFSWHAFHTCPYNGVIDKRPP